MANFSGMRRRAPDDPFSDAARFPSLANDAQAQTSSTYDALQNAGAQHFLAQADGANSIAARNDPLQYGSIFSRWHSGALDAFQDQPRQQDAGMPRRSVAATPEVAATPKVAATPEVSSIDRYAARMGYLPDGSSPTPTPSPMAPQGFGGHTPGRLNRRSVNGVPTFDDY